MQNPAFVVTSGIKNMIRQIIDVCRVQKINIK